MGLPDTHRIFKPADGKPSKENIRSWLTAAGMSHIESLSDEYVDIMLKTGAVNAESLKKAYALEQMVHAMLDNAEGDVISWEGDMPEAIALALGDINAYMTKHGTEMDLESTERLCQANIRDAKKDLTQECSALFKANANKSATLYARINEYFDDSFVVSAKAADLLVQEAQLSGVVKNGLLPEESRRK